LNQEYLISSGKTTLFCRLEASGTGMLDDETDSSDRPTCDPRVKNFFRIMNTIFCVLAILIMIIALILRLYGGGETDPRQGRPVSYGGGFLAAVGSRLGLIISIAIGLLVFALIILAQMPFCQPNSARSI
jgi:hypothetical protein